MLQKLKVNNFEWIDDTSQFNKDFIKSYNKESDERMKIKKVEKLVTNLHDKSEHVIHIRNLKQALNPELILKKFIEWLNLIKKLD